MTDREFRFYEIVRRVEKMYGHASRLDIAAEARKEDLGVPGDVFGAADYLRPILGEMVSKGVIKAVPGFGSTYKTEMDLLTAMAQRLE